MDAADRASDTVGRPSSASDRSRQAGTMGARTDGGTPPGSSLPSAHGDDEPRAADVAARVRRLAFHGGPAEQEPTARPRETGDRSSSVDCVVRRQAEGDADALGALRSAWTCAPCVRLGRRSLREARSATGRSLNRLASGSSPMSRSPHFLLLSPVLDGTPDVQSEDDDHDEHGRDDHDDDRRETRGNEYHSSKCAP